MKIAPSILAADFADLAHDVERVAQDADQLHVDVMDGHFVPNISFGPVVLAALRKRTDMFLDCHLMITDPAAYLDAFVDAGADGITVHVEVGHTNELIERIRAHRLRVGLTLNPDTPFDAVVPYLDRIDTLLIMSVHPGFGGQGFIASSLDKVRAARAIIDREGYRAEIEIDGGIKVDNAAAAAAAGCEILVAGSAVFGASDPAAAVRAIREAAQRVGVD